MSTAPNPAAKPAKNGTVWKAVLVLFIVFTLGIAAGVGGSFLYVRNQIRAATFAPLKGRVPADILMDRVEAHLNRELNLTPSESTAVREELSVTRREFKELRFRLVRDLRGMIGEAMDRVGKRLPAEKKTQMEKNMERWLEPWGLRQGVRMRQNAPESGTKP
jgi:hypothetical protein